MAENFSMPPVLCRVLSLPCPPVTVGKPGSVPKGSSRSPSVRTCHFNPGVQCGLSQTAYTANFRLCNTSCRMCWREGIETARSTAKVILAQRQRVVGTRTSRGDRVTLRPSSIPPPDAARAEKK